MNRLRWYIRVWKVKLGREGLLGVSLLLLSLGVYLTILLPADSQIKLIEQKIDASTIASGQRAENTPTKPASLPDRLAAFYRFFPPQTSTPSWLGKIYQAAKREHLALNEGKYTAVHERAGKLIRYEINLPVTGNYHQVHKFVGKILNDIPIAALNGITYERSKIGDTAVKAKIKISLYLGQPL